MPIQRIHGDCHLGRALPARNGWRYVDSEGGPIKPLQERRKPGSPLQDVASMLRSFDCVMANGHTFEGWRDDTRATFLNGYGDSIGILADVLLACEVGKVIYEVVYEARNHPTHLRIPVDYLTGIES